MSGARVYPRKILRCPASVQVANARLRARTIDISLGGVSVMVEQQLAPGALCQLSFEARLNGNLRQVSASAKVIYSILSGTDGFRTGLQFVDIDAANNKTLAEFMI